MYGSGEKPFFIKERPARNKRKRRRTMEGLLFMDSKKYDNLYSTEREYIIHYSEAFKKNA